MGNASFNLKDLPGKHSNTILLLEKNTGYSFLIEAIDKALFEFTICIYDNEDDINRLEYVLTCNKKSLSDLKRCIETVLK